MIFKDMLLKRFLFAMLVQFQSSVFQIYFVKELSEQFSYASI